MKLDYADAHSEILFDRIPKPRKFEDYLLQATDNLRANARLKSSEYAAPLLGLFFLRYASNRFDTVSEQAEREFEQGKESRNSETVEEVYRRLCGFFVPTEARYETLLDLTDADNANSLKKISLSQIDFEKLQQRFKASPFKNLSISDLIDFLKDRVRKMLAQNVTRTDLAQRLRDIINNYNHTSSDVEAFFKALKEYAEQLREEEKRSASEGLSEEELEIFDLLFQENLNEADKKKVKEAAQTLLEKLKDNETKRTVLTADWYKNEQLRRSVDKMIGDVLDKNLPASYDKPTFQKKRKAVYFHVYKTASQGKAYWT